MRFQLGLLDDDPIALFSPLLDNKLAFSGCLLLHSAAQIRQAKTLVREYAPFAVQIELLEIADTADSDDLSFFFQEIFEDYKTREISLWLNASCGARLQVLTAAAVAQAYQQRVFVVNSSNDSLLWLSPACFAAHSLTDRIKLPHFLSLYEIELKQSGNLQTVPQAWRELGASWSASVAANLQALARLNWLAQTADNNHLTEPLSHSLLQDVQLQGLLDDLEGLNMLTWHADNRIAFVNDETRFFANGGWLEMHVLGLIKGLTKSIPTLQDYGHSLVVERQVKGHRLVNEIDVAVLENNRLHIIECKTKRFDKHEADTAIFKLDALTEVLGGVDAKGLLVSFHDIAPRQMARAAELGIDIISGREIAQLKTRLLNWFRSP